MKAWSALLVLTLTVAAAMGAPNDSQWDARFGPSGVLGTVGTIGIRGTDGFVGGNFSHAGGIPATNIACCSGGQWSDVGGLSAGEWTSVSEPVPGDGSALTVLHAGGGLPAAGLYRVRTRAMQAMMP
jgi:hypothetical protein